MTPSGAHATVAQPLAEPLDRLVVHAVDLDLERAQHAAEARALAHDLHRVRRLVRAAPSGCGRARRADSLAMSCTSVPPSATLSTWMPRQIANSGTVVVDAPGCVSPISSASRAGETSSTVGCARLAEARGLDVAAAREQQAVQPLPERRLDLGREVRRQQHGDAAGGLHGPDVGAVDVGALGDLVDRDRRGDADEWRSHEASLALDGMMAQPWQTPRRQVMPP